MFRGSQISAKMSEESADLDHNSDSDSGAQLKGPESAESDAVLSPFKCCHPDCQVMFSSSSPETLAWSLQPCWCNLCGECLAAFGEGAKDFKCPGCHGKVRSYLNNTLLVRAADSASPPADTAADKVACLCDFCDADAALHATSACSTCKMMLCEVHVNSHKRGRGTKDHELVDISVPPVGTAATRQPDVCSAHLGNPLAQYCFKCKVGLCMHCDFRKHIKECDDARSIPEAIVLLKEQLGVHCKRLTAVCSKLDQEVIAKQSLETKFISEMRATVTKMETGFDELIAFVQSTKQSVLNLLNFEIEEKLAMLTAHIALMKRRSGQLSAGVSEDLKLCENGTASDLTEALKWSSMFELASSWSTLGSLHVDAAVNLDAAKAAISASWCVTTLPGSSAFEKV